MQQVFHNTRRVCNLKESRLMRHFIPIYDAAGRKILLRDTWLTFGYANVAAISISLIHLSLITSTIVSGTIVKELRYV